MNNKNNTYKPLLIVISLLTVAIYTSYVIISDVWVLPILEIFTASAQLPLADLAKQLSIVPTMLVAVFAGGLLGVVSLLLQQLVKNPLASDTTLAVGGGAQLALLLVTLFLPNYSLYGSFWVAFVGALLSMGLVFFIALPSRMNPLVLVIVGLIVNICISAISALCLIFFSEKALGIMSWSSGVLTQISWQTTQKLGITSLIFMVVLIPLLKPLSLMILDDRQAKSLGVPVSFIRAIVILLVAIITALVVSEIGILGFIGLGAATLVNVLAIRQLAMRLIMGFIMGGLLLLVASNVATLAMQSLPMLIPAGAITGIVGAPLIIWIILQATKDPVETVIPHFSVPRRTFTSSFWAVWLIAILGLLGFFLVFTQTITGWQISLDSQLINQFRLPRSLSALTTGMMLACAGVLIQTLTANPMASPEVLGVSSGAAVGVLLAVIVFSVFGIPLNLGVIFVAGIIGAVLVLLLILRLARSLNPSHIVLIGIAITALMSGILGIIKLLGDPRLQAILSWLSGTTYSARPNTVWWLSITAVVLCTASMILIKPLNALSLGNTIAKGRGVRINIAQGLIILVIAGLSATATLAVGPLSFIGLMVPHLATSLGAVQLQHKLPLAMLIGALLMLTADWLGRYLIFPYEIPAGVLVAVMGGVYFIVLMRKVNY